MNHFALTERVGDASVTVVTPFEYAALLQATLVSAGSDIIVHEGDMTSAPYRFSHGPNDVELMRKGSGLALRYARNGREIFVEEISLNEGPDEATVFQVLEHLNDDVALTRY